MTRCCSSASARSAAPGRGPSTCACSSPTAPVSVPAVVWDDVDDAAATATAGEPVRVIGTVSEHPRYGRQLTVQSVLAPLEVDWERLLDSPATAVAELERRLDAYIAGLAEPHLAALMERLLGTESSSGRAFPARVRRPVQPSRLPLRAARALAAGRRRDRRRRPDLRGHRPRPRRLRRAAARHRQARRLLRRRVRRRR